MGTSEHIHSAMTANRHPIPDMSETQFCQWSRLLEERTGMRVRDSRRSFLNTSVRLRMRELGFSDYQTYYDYLLSGREGAAEWARLVDRLTVHETRFFRHPESLEQIARDFLPGYLAERPDIRSIQAWSVGSATGEEPYSLAIILDAYLRTSGGHYYYGVTGSDISMPSLASARDAVYHRRRLQNVPHEHLDLYFTRVDDEHYRVTDRIRKRTCFNHLNILEAGQAPVGMMDIIVCQNVLIYFEQEMRHEILDALIHHLNPGGILILGAGEALSWRHEEITRCGAPGTLTFRRKHHGQGQ